MRIGSIVECVYQAGGRLPEPVVYPILGHIYTVKKILDVYGETFITLDEINICGLHGQEMACLIEDFREIQFPPDLEAEIKECLVREFEEV